LRLAGEQAGAGHCFSKGPEWVSNTVRRRFGREYERFLARHNLSRWTEFVLETVLDLPWERWRKFHELPEDVQVSLLGL